jgi:uncharacterized protein
MVFEIFSSFIPHFGLDATRRELEQLHDLWASRGSRARSARSVRPTRTPSSSGADVGVSPTEWEKALGSLVIGRAPATMLEQELATDPGVPLVHGLIKEFRASMVVAVYRLTSRLLMLALGPDVFRALLEDFWSKTPPQQYAGTEAELFGQYLAASRVRIPQLQSILAFERAALDTMRDGQPRIVRFTVDPIPMLRALLDGVLLENPGTPGEYEIEVTADGPITVSGVDAEAVNQTFPFH